MLGLEETFESRPSLLKTVAAIVVAIVVSAIVGLLVAILMDLGNRYARFVGDPSFSDWFIDIWGQVVGAGLGVYASRFACDRYLQPYSRHTVFLCL